MMDVIAGSVMDIDAGSVKPGGNGIKREAGGSKPRGGRAGLNADDANDDGSINVVFKLPRQRAARSRPISTRGRKRAVPLRHRQGRPRPTASPRKRQRQQKSPRPARRAPRPRPSARRRRQRRRRQRCDRRRRRVCVARGCDALGAGADGRPRSRPRARQCPNGQAARDLTAHWLCHAASAARECCYDVAPSSRGLCGSSCRRARAWRNGGPRARASPATRPRWIRASCRSTHKRSRTCLGRMRARRAQPSLPPQPCRCRCRWRPSR